MPIQVVTDSKYKYKYKSKYIYIYKYKYICIYKYKYIYKCRQIVQVKPVAAKKTTSDADLGGYRFQEYHTFCRDPSLFLLQTIGA